MEKIEYFECEGFYYKVQRGSIYSSCGYARKSTNLLIQRLGWKLKKTEVMPIDDFKKNGYL